MSNPKFPNGSDVKIQPSKKSNPLFGKVISASWNDSFNEFAYYVQLTSGIGSTAWERQLSA